MVKLHYKNIFSLTSLLILSFLLYPIFNVGQEMSQLITTQFRDPSLVKDLAILDEFLSNASLDMKDISANNRFKGGIIDSSADYDPQAALYSFFRENRGQVPDYLRYYAQLSNGLVGFGLSKIYFIIDDNSFELDFLRANNVQPKGAQPLPSYSNYFLGNQVFTQVDHYAQIVYPELYEGITLTYQLTSQGLKYEFFIAPFADINQIQMMYSGVVEVHVDPSQVTLQLSSSKFFDDGLAVWYADNHQAIESAFECYPSADSSFASSKVIHFTLDNRYDSSRAIIIDPLFLNISTFIDGNLDDHGRSLALDSANNVYLTGQTGSSDFPTTPGAYDTTHNGEKDVFVCKLSPDGTTLVYSTFIGGTEDDRGYSLALDSVNNVYLTGETNSISFPTTPGAYDTTHNGAEDVFFCKLSPDGTTLVYSTFIGGIGFDYGCSLALDSENDVYIAGETLGDFPTTSGANDTTYNGGFTDIFVCKLSADGSNLLYSTFIGGSYSDSVHSLALDSSNNVYLTGWTDSSDFPITPDAYDTTYNDNSYSDVFFCKLSPDGTTLVYSTFIGGNNRDYGLSLALDSINNVYLTGRTGSSDFPTTPGAYDTTYNGEKDVFVCKLSPDGTTLVYSTFIGGNNTEYGLSLALDSINNVYLTGYTYSSDFPTTPGAYDTTHNGWGEDVFFCKLSPDGTTLVYSTFIGGTEDDRGYSLALDSANNVYLTGETNSISFPTTPGAYDTTHNGRPAVFVCKLLSTPTVTITSPITATYAQDSVTLIYSISSWTSIEAVAVYLDGVVNNTVLPSGSVIFNLVDGTHNLTIVAMDEIGNLGKSTVIFAILKDSDLDGMPDTWEVSNGLNMTLDDASEDPDADGLTNLGEYNYKTDPHNSDTDTDGIPDGYEVSNGLDPTLDDASEDPDGDGLTNLEEYANGTLPLSNDTDGDGLPDGWEINNNLNPNNAADADYDNDNDGLTNLQEYQVGTDPFEFDLLFISLLLQFITTPLAIVFFSAIAFVLGGITSKYTKRRRKKKER
ncbi:MAG: SBBP repeat-containing protein [Candidatus Hermodarchaeota archaeon]